MNLTKRVLFSFCILSLGINFVGSSMAQTSSQVPSQTIKELNDKLLEASKKGNGENIKELVGIGANVNAQDNNGCTALHYVAEEGNVECIKVLISLGANIEAQDWEGSTALHWAAKGGRVVCIKVLVDLGANIDARDKSGSTALHWSTHNGLIECIKMLVNLGAKVNVQDKGGWTALHDAVNNGCVGCIRVLVDLGGGIDAQDNDGLTPLQMASRRGHVECVKVLIDLGASIEAQDCGGWTVLHWAAYEDHVGCIKVLIDLGANIDARDKSGSTALHWAATGGRVECIKVLVELRANRWIRDNKQRTALDLAILSGSEDTLKAIVKLSYLLLNLSEGNILSARNRVRASLWALSHGPVTEDSQTGERRRLGLPKDPRSWVLLSDSTNPLCKAVMYVFLSALRNGRSKKLGLLVNAKAEAVKYLLEELKKRFAYLRTLPDIEPDRAKLVDPDSVISNFESDVLAGINERIDELNERIQDDTVSSSSAVSLSSEKKARLY